jgi:hypothetical protein
MSLEPITYRYDLSCRHEQAFDTYASRIGEWWPANYTANPETLENVVIESQAHGRVYERHNDGTEIEWGHVTTWDPPGELAYTSTLAQTTDYPSKITVRFTPDDNGCHMVFDHGGWGPDNASYRAKFGDWPIILESFVHLAEQPATDEPMQGSLER